MLRGTATAIVALVALSCGAGDEGPAAPRPAPPPPVAADDALVVAFLGDSLTAGFGLSEEEAFPALVERRLLESGVAVRVVNAGVSGDTSAGGLRRIGWVLKQDPDVVVVGLGANDGLRGQPPESTEENLREILRAARGSGSRVLLLGMRIPTNYGRDYAEAFAAIYPRLAKELSVPLVPFLLDGVGGRPDLNLADGIHPNARGHARLAENVLAALRPLIEERPRRPRAPAGRRPRPRGRAPGGESPGARPRLRPYARDRRGAPRG